MILSPLVTEALPGDWWRLREPLIGNFNPEFPVSAGDFYIPAGFVTNFASVPQILRGVLSRKDSERAATWHDFVYQKGYLEHENGGLVFMTRKNADDMLYHIGRHDGMGVIRAWIYWSGVRLNTGGAWPRE